MRNFFLSSNDGFTLIEIMIVIGIIGILTAISIPNFISYRRDSANGMAKSEAKNFYNAALAAAAKADTDTAWSTGSPPIGLSPNTTDITWTGDIQYKAADDSITSTLTATHVKGNITYSIAGDGVITP